MTQPSHSEGQLFASADTSSLRGQRDFILGTRLKLLVTLLAAICGIKAVRSEPSGIDILGIIAVCLFVAALVLELILWRTHPERKWYDGRALAESVKTLTWKFAVAGEPFPKSMSATAAKKKYISLLAELRQRYRADLDPVVAEYIPPWAVECRTKTLKERRSVYLADRLKDQQNWYLKKSRANRRAARIWRSCLVILEVGGVIASVLVAANFTSLRLAGVFAAAIGCAGVWLALKQHDQNANAYGTAVIDLGEAAAKLSVAVDEEDWAREMNDAEDAISREHTVWLASRSY